MKNISSIVEIKYFPFFLSGKNVNKKLSNSDNIYKKDLVLGVLSPKQNEVYGKDDILGKFILNSEKANIDLYNRYGEILKSENDLDILNDFEFSNEISDPKDLALFTEKSPEDNDVETIR